MTLPNNWSEMSLEALWRALNDPEKPPTPQATIDAVIETVRERGLIALHDDSTLERLRRCDEAARVQINARIAKMYPEAVA